MKRINLSLLIFLIMLPLFLSCGDALPDITKGVSTTVDDRFNESIDGKTKKIVLPIDNGEKFNFLWLTDMHIRDDRKDYFPQLGNFATAHNSSFIITSGDLTNDGESDNYDYVLYQVDKYLSVPFYSAIGNHDLYGDGWDEFKKKIGPSTASFTYGGALFVILDTASCEVGRDQMDWLEDTLKDSHEKHKFIFSHMCLYNKVAELPIILCDPDERLRLLSLLRDYKVDFFLCGHGHYDEKIEIDGTTHIQGATASAWNNPMNGDPEFFQFSIDGSSLDYKKIYFKDIEF